MKAVRRLFTGLLLAAASCSPALAQYRPGLQWKDAQGRVVAEVNDKGVRIDYEYESDGRRVLNGGRLVAVEKLDGTIIAYGYDQAGNKVQTRITGKGQAARYIDHQPRPVERPAQTAPAPEAVHIASISKVEVERHAATVIRGDIGRVASVTTTEGATTYDYFPDDDRPLILAVTLNGKREVYDKQIAVSANSALTTPAQSPSTSAAQGGELPLSGMYLTPSGRWYDPSTGRFTQQDSYLGNIYEPASLNRYTYAHSNPTSFIDPTGHESYRQWLGLDKPTPDFWYEASKEIGYRSFNLISLGALGRQDRLVEQFEAGRITDEQYGRRTMANAGGTAAVAGAAVITGGLGGGVAGGIGTAGGLTAAEVTLASSVAAGSFGALGAQAASDLVELHGTQTKSVGDIQTSDYLLAVGIGAAAGPIASRIGNSNLPSLEGLNNPVTAGTVRGLELAGQYAYRAGANSARAMVAVEGRHGTVLVPADGVPSRPPNSPHYSVAYEAQLQKGVQYPGVADTRHFQEANRQLYLAMTQNPEFAAAMESQYPGLTKGVTPGPRGAFSTKPPTKDVTWHHHPEREGVLQLVPRIQHRAPGPVQQSLHPDQKGGMENWGGGRNQ